MSLTSIGFQVHLDPSILHSPHGFLIDAAFKYDHHLGVVKPHPKLDSRVNLGVVKGQDTGDCPFGGDNRSIGGRVEGKGHQVQAVVISETADCRQQLWSLQVTKRERVTIRFQSIKLARKKSFTKSKSYIFTNSAKELSKASWL